MTEPATDEQIAAYLKANHSIKKPPWTMDLIARIEAEKALRPVEMPGCKIRFRECEKGHGWLTADNWVDHGCQTCALQSEKARANEHARSIVKAAERIAELTRRAIRAEGEHVALTQERNAEKARADAGVRENTRLRQENAKYEAQQRERIAELEARLDYCNSEDNAVAGRQRIAELERRLAVALECIADGIDDHWIEYPEHAKLIKEARGEGGA